MVRVGDHVYGYTDSGSRWVCFEYKKGGEDPVWESKKLDKGSVTVRRRAPVLLRRAEAATCVLVEASPGAGGRRRGGSICRRRATPAARRAIWAHPVVANGKLYLRDHELLFCFDIAAK